MKEFFICLIVYWIVCLMIDIHFKRKNIEILKRNIVYWIVCLMIDIHFKRKNIEILKRNIEIIQEATRNEKKKGKLKW